MHFYFSSMAATANPILFSSLAFVLILLSVSAVHAEGEIRSRKMDDDIAIQHVSILLPLTETSRLTTFSLHAYNGCFRWTSANEEIITVEPLYASDACNSNPNPIRDPFHDGKSSRGQCSGECMISVVQSGMELRSTTFVIAEDIATGRKLRCEVFVDKIDSIAIETTTRRMYHDDNEELNILAFDRIGNLFNTLGGLEFQWDFENLNKQRPEPLKFITYGETNIEVSPDVLEMERRGKRTYSILIKGISSGKARVTAQLSENGYRGLVAPHSVDISVMEPIELYPTHSLYMTPGSSFQYELRTFKNEITRNIPMPNTQYLWSQSDPSVIHLDNRGFVHGINIGTSSIKVQHEDIEENSAYGRVHVIWPTQLAMKLYPIDTTMNSNERESNWYIVKGKSYELQMELLDDASHSIFISPEMFFDVDIPHDRFSIVSRSKNNEKIVIRALKEGLTDITGRLRTLEHPLPIPLAVRHDVLISEAISISPVSIRLPFVATRHTATFYASGGSNDYEWYSSDPSIATVDRYGQITSHAQGEAHIMAIDIRNPNNRATASVHVQPVGKIELIPVQREVLVESSLLLSIAFYDQEGFLYTNGSSIPFHWKIGDPSVFRAVPTDLDLSKLPTGFKSTMERACTFRTVQAISEGQSTVSVWSGDGLRSEISIFSFLPLSVDTPHALVTLGSSFTYYIHGGPRPWLYEPNLYRSKMIPEEISSVLLVPTPLTPHSSSPIAFEVICKEYGTQTLQISAGNEASSENPFPGSSFISTVFSCAPPSSLQLQPVLSLPIDKDCDMKYQWNMESMKQGKEFLLRNQQILPFRVLMLNRDGKHFDNTSSILYDWDIDNKHVGRFNGAGDDSNSLELADALGVARISVHVRGYDSSLLRKHRVYNTRSIEQHNKLQGTIQLKIIGDLSIAPAHQTIILHKDNKGYLDIIGGSTLLETTHNDTTGILEIKKEKTSQTSRMELIPLSCGTVKITKKDRCLYGSVGVGAVIQVSKIAKITIRAVVSSVSVGENLEVIVYVYDQNGNLFSDEQFRYMDLLGNWDRKILSNLPSTEQPSHFLLQGISPGTTSLSFHSFISGEDGGAISSNSIPITVFHPFELPMEPIVLTPGISHVMDTTGGPPGTTITFTSSDEGIVSVDDNGRLTAHKAGTCTIRAVASGIDDGKVVVYGEQVRTIIIKDFSQIEIRLPATTVVVGTVMNAVVYGSEGQTPISVGCGMEYKWNSSNLSVLQIAPRYEESGCSLEEEHMFSVRVIAQKAGKALLSTETRTNDGGSGMARLLHSGNLLQASTLIHVIEPLEIISPRTLLMTPSSSFVIETNLDHLDTLLYSVHSLDHCDSLYQPCTVSPQAVISTKEICGVCYVLVEESNSSLSELLRVEVKPFHAIQIHPIDSPPHHVYVSIPIGARMEFMVIYVDESARRFDAVMEPEEYSIYLSDENVVSVRSHGSSMKISAVGKYPGSSILRLRKGDAMNDFIELRVGNTIIPDDRVLHLGSEVTYKLQFDPTEGANTEGEWKSSNDAVLRVHKATGTAKALMEGEATISYMKNNVAVSQRVVTVSKILRIEIFVEKDQILSNYDPDDTYMFPVTLKARGSEIRVTSESEIDAACFIEPSYFAKATMVTDKSGALFCSVSSLVSTRDAITADEILPDLFTLSVSVSDKAETYTKKHTIVLPFIPQFEVVEEAQGPIRLNRNLPKIHLTIKHGLTPLQVLSSDPNRVGIHSVSSMLDMTVYEIEVLDLTADSLWEKITFSAADQEKIIEVIYTNTKEFLHSEWNYDPQVKSNAYMASVATRGNETSSSTFQLIIITLITILALVAGYYFCFSGSEEENTFSTTPRTPSSATRESRVSTPFRPSSPLSPSDRTPFYMAPTPAVSSPSSRFAEKRSYPPSPVTPF